MRWGGRKSDLYAFTLVNFSCFKSTAETEYKKKKKIKNLYPACPMSEYTYCYY